MCGMFHAKSLASLAIQFSQSDRAVIPLPTNGLQRDQQGFGLYRYKSRTRSCPLVPPRTIISRSALSGLSDCWLHGSVAVSPSDTSGLRRRAVLYYSSASPNGERYPFPTASGLFCGNEIFSS